MKLSTLLTLLALIVIVIVAWGIIGQAFVMGGGSHRCPAGQSLYTVTYVSGAQETICK